MFNIHLKYLSIKPPRQFLAELENARGHEGHPKIKFKMGRIFQPAWFSHGTRFFSHVSSYLMSPNFS